MNKQELEAIESGDESKASPVLQSFIEKVNFPPHLCVCLKKCFSNSICWH